MRVILRLLAIAAATAAATYLIFAPVAPAHAQVDPYKRRVVDPYAPINRPVPADRGREDYDYANDAPVRLKTPCRLVIEGDERFLGRCDVGRKGRVTLIDAGGVEYRIEREIGDNTRGRLYRGARLLDYVYARGGCWVNDESLTRYCAN